MNKAKVISLANLKGGVGKTSTTVLLSVQLANMGYKVATMDLDPQANLSDALLNTANINSVDNTLANSIFDSIDLHSITINIKKNLDLIPSAFDIFNYERYLFYNYQNELDMIQDLNKRLDEIRPDYDFIFIDTPPAISIMNDNAFSACSEIIFIMQTEKRSYEATKNFISYIKDELVAKLGAQTSVLGVLPVLMDNNSPLDKIVLKGARDYYGSENIFNNVITNQRRIKRMDYTGVTENSKDKWDVQVNNKFKALAQELVERTD